MVTSSIHPTLSKTVTKKGWCFGVIVRDVDKRSYVRSDYIEDVESNASCRESAVLSAQ